MPKYKVSYEVRMVGYIDASNEDEAKQLAHDSEIDFVEDEMTSDVLVMPA